ncbi:amidohydrolase family protein [Parashewanella tropica]|uniref:amidohydrolase family protein n=1 Tax=Parashewanella tropica TaxID=2547970 RepID=UPI001C5520AC|nr:amidohydrolase family protein [Parashewanella tropica]
MTKTIRIDSHQHFWKRSRGDYGWLTPELNSIYRDFMPTDLTSILSQNEIDKTILVQAAPTLAETAFLLEIAEKTAFVAGVVGWVDFENPAATEHLRKLSANPYFKGVRPMIQDIDDPDWMLNPELDLVFKTLIDLDLTFDALVLPKHLSNLLVLLKRYPELKVVIDHCAKPNITEKEFTAWAENMTRLAEKTSAYCKLSGLVTEAPRYSEISVFQPYVDLLCTRFGAQRLMWGSDWPVINLSSTSYEQWNTMSVSMLKRSGFNKQQIEQVMGANAAKFYQLEGLK